MRRIDWASRLGGRGCAAFPLLLFGCTSAASNEWRASGSQSLTADDPDGGPIVVDGGGGKPEDGSSPDGGSTGPLGFWTFDDCSSTSNQLADSSGQGATATRSPT